MLATGRSIHSAFRTWNSTLLRPRASARSRAPTSIASAWSETITPPIGATSSAASMPVSPRPAASSSTRSPGCGTVASIIQCETGAPNSRIARCWRAQPEAASSQLRRLSSRCSFGSKLIAIAPPRWRGEPSRFVPNQEQLLAQELARAGARQRLLDEQHLLGHLVSGELASTMGAQRLTVGDRPRPPHDDRRDGLAPVLIGAGHDRRLEHVGVGLEHRLDLRGRDVLAAADDRVGLAPGNPQPA